MHFLIDADMPRKTAEVLIAAGHVATDVRDIGLGSADDAVIAVHAKANGSELFYSAAMVVQQAIPLVDLNRVRRCTPPR